MYTGCVRGTGIICFLVCLMAMLVSIMFSEIGRHICFFLLLYLVGVAYVNFHELAIYPRLNYRKTITLTIYPYTIHEKTSEKVVYGYARILGAPKRYDKIVGHRIYFIAEHNGEVPARGQKLQIKTQVEYIGKRKSKPFLKFLRKNHVFLYASKGKIEKYLSTKSCFDRLCERYRRKFLYALKCGLNDRSSIGIITGMLTGSKHMLSSEQKNDFCSTGTAHVFAISGFHIGVIALFFDWFLRLLKLSRRLRALPVIAILFVYLNIIGPTPASMRAYTTVFFYYAAAVFSRRSNAFSSFANSAAVNICRAPESVFDISFLLSYGIVFGIICVGSNLNRLLRNLKWKTQQLRSRTFAEKIKESVCSNLLENFCVAFAAGITGIPLSVEFFGNFSYLTIFINLFLVPLASAVIFLGGVSLLLGTINMFALCALVNKLASVPIFLINFTLNCSRKIGHGLVNVSCPFDGIWMPSLVLVAVVGWCLKKLSDRIRKDNDSLVVL
ncbi:MAG: ComEC/Rec2 family competence protein [Puniceicoccales bacterium]|nr:ComEC/Rec2 family competence protein [Puniceicoccales bacterium]